MLTQVIIILNLGLSMTVKEGNKLIAEFLDIKVSPNEEFFGSTLPNIICKTSTGTKQLTFGDPDVEFLETVLDLKIKVLHEDWDLLLTTVDLIESLGYNVNICSGEVAIYKRSVLTYDVGKHNKYDYYSSSWNESKLKTLYQEIVKFIKHYNENNSSLQS